MGWRCAAYVPGTHLRVPQLKLNAASPAAAGLQPEACQQVAASLQDADGVVVRAMQAYDQGLAAAGAVHALLSGRCCSGCSL